MKPKLISFVSALLLLVFAVYVNAASVRLQWDMNCESNVVKYILYYTTNVLTTPETEIDRGGTNECGKFYPPSTNIFYGQYSTLVEVLGRTNTNCHLSNLVTDVKYYFTIAAANNSGLQSLRSAEISHIIPKSTNSVATNKVGGLTVISFQD